MPSRAKPSTVPKKKAAAGNAATTKASAPAAKASSTKSTKKSTKKSTTEKAATPAPARKAAVPAKNTTTKQAAAPKKVAAPAKTAKAAPAAKQAKAAPAAKQAKDPALDKFLHEQVALLEHERQAYTEQAAALKAEADQLAQDMEPGDIQFDEESGEGGTMNIDRERDLALSAQARAAVDEIDHAMAKVATGTYGACENCGQPIPKARLKALPYARLCVGCKSGGLSRR